MILKNNIFRKSTKSEIFADSVTVKMQIELNNSQCKINQSKVLKKNFCRLNRIKYLRDIHATCNSIISLVKKIKTPPKPLHMTVTRPYTFFSTQEEKQRKQAACKKGKKTQNLNTFQKCQQMRLFQQSICLWEKKRNLLSILLLQLSETFCDKSNRYQHGYSLSSFVNLFN